MLDNGTGGDEADVNPDVPVDDVPGDLAAMSDSLFALRGPEASAYRALAGEYLVLAVEVELALDVLLGMWFIEMDRELFSEFDVILQRIGLERKVQTVKRLIQHESAGALLARVDRVQRLRNKIAHQSPRIEPGAVHFSDRSLTAEQFEAEIRDARELSLELLDTLFPQVIERRRRWGARDGEDLSGLAAPESDGGAPAVAAGGPEPDGSDSGAPRSRRRRSVRRRKRATAREGTPPETSDE